MKSDLTWLRQTCWLNDARLAGPVRGVALIFTGLGCGYHGEYYTPFELDMAERGVLTVHVHYGPWSWMNREARRFVDRAVATVYAGFGLDDSVPLISFGGSMGGCATLLYACYGAKAPAAVVAHWPVCDMVYHFTERVDIAPTFHHAFGSYPEPLEEVILEHSPLAQVGRMPDVPYLVIHGDRDLSVNKEAHSDRFVAAMRAAGRQIEYLEIPGMGHGTNVPPVFHRRTAEFIDRYLP